MTSEDWAFLAGFVLAALIVLLLGITMRDHYKPEPHPYVDDAYIIDGKVYVEVPHRCYPVER